MFERFKYIQYLRLSDIVVLSSKWWEESSGLQNEHKVEELACRKNGRPHRITVHWVWKYFRGESLRIGKEEAISEAEYERLCQEHGDTFDTPEYRARLDQYSELFRRIGETIPSCPKCGRGMVRRSGSYGEFWGCSDYPKCTDTRKLTARLKAKLDTLETQRAALYAKLTGK